MEEAEIWRAEEELWLQDAEAYRRLLDRQCVMVFGGFGVLHGADAVVAALEGAPRWATVEIRERVMARPRPDLAVLAYRVEARREGADAYRAWCGSTWRRDSGGWRMIQHAQAPQH